MRQSFKSSAIAAAAAATLVAVPAAAQTIYPIPTSTSVKSVNSANTALGKVTNKKGAVASILRKGSVSARVSFPGPGKYTVRYKSGSRTYATGTRTRSSAGAATIKVKLTAAGKRAFRTARAARKSIKLRLTTTFNPTSGSTVTRNKTIRVKK